MENLNLQEKYNELSKLQGSEINIKNATSLDRYGFSYLVNPLSLLILIKYTPKVKKVESFKICEYDENSFRENDLPPSLLK